MSNIKTFPGAVAVTPGEVNEGLVAMLEQVLEDAKAGMLQSFIAMGFRYDGTRMTCFTPHPNVYEFCGGIEWLKRDYMERYGGGDSV